MRRPSRRAYGRFVPGKTFFVETYVPLLDAEISTELTTRLRAAVEDLRREGLEICWLRSFAAGADETFVWLLRAPEIDHVGRVSRRAGVAYDHVVEVISDDERRP
jgi:hypothetical protein